MGPALPSLCESADSRSIRATGSNRPAAATRSESCSGGSAERAGASLIGSEIAVPLVATGRAFAWRLWPPPMRPRHRARAQQRLHTRPRRRGSARPAPAPSSAEAQAPSPYLGSAQATDQPGAEPAVSTFAGHHPGTLLPGRIVPHVLIVTALELRHPVTLLVLMETDDEPLRCHLTCSGQGLSTVHSISFSRLPTASAELLV